MSPIQQRRVLQLVFGGSRDAGIGGGALAPPPTWKLRERRPPTLDCRSRSFLLFLFSRELEPLPPKELWAKSGEFLALGRVTLDPERRLPRNFKVVPPSLSVSHISHGFVMALDTSGTRHPI